MRTPTQRVIGEGCTDRQAIDACPCSVRLRGTPSAASSTLAQRASVVGLAMKPVGKPDAGNRHVQFDEWGRETEQVPHGSSYRALPRLYLVDRPAARFMADTSVQDAQV